MQDHRALIALGVAGLLLAATAQAKIPRSRQAIAEFKAQQPCPANGRRSGACPGWQIDHRIPLKCGGPDEPSNMQWLTVEDHKTKTRNESAICLHRGNQQ